MLNNGAWNIADGPLHDLPSEMMFLALKRLHDQYCVHIDIDFSPLMKIKLNDFFFAINQYSLPTANSTINTFSFDVTVSNGAYIINGNVAPVLQLIKGYTYVFTMTNAAYLKYPLTIGTSVGVPFCALAVTEQYDVKNIAFFLPFTAPTSLVYYSSNVTATGNRISTIDPVSYEVAQRYGQYFLNDQPNPTINIHIGVTYSFVITNSDQALFPFVIGTAFNHPYTAGTAITVTEGTYSTRFTVTITDTSLQTLVYYCQYNPLMTGTINIIASVSSSLKSSSSSSSFLSSSSKIVTPTTITSCNGQYSGPRSALQMSLYCALSNLATSLPAAITQKPYYISTTCDIIARSFLATSLYAPTVFSPSLFCDQTPVPGVDSCEVLTYVIADGHNCKTYCESFPGLILQFFFQFEFLEC